MIGSKGPSHLGSRRLLRHAHNRVLEEPHARALHGRGVGAMTVFLMTAADKARSTESKALRLSTMGLPKYDESA